MTERGVIRAGYRRFTPPEFWTEADACYGKWLRDSEGRKVLHVVLKRYDAKLPFHIVRWEASVQLRRDKYTKREAVLDLSLHHPFRVVYAERLFLEAHRLLGFDPEEL